MTDRLEALAAEFDEKAEQSRQLADHPVAGAWEDAAERVREVAAELAPRVMPGLDDTNDTATADLGAAPAPIYDDVHAEVYGNKQ